LHRVYTHLFLVRNKCYNYYSVWIIDKHYWATAIIVCGGSHRRNLHGRPGSFNIRYRRSDSYTLLEMTAEDNGECVITVLHPPPICILFLYGGNDAIISPLIIGCVSYLFRDPFSTSSILVFYNDNPLWCSNMIHTISPIHSNNPQKQW